MGININKKTTFGPYGFLIARNNPDGTPASPSRVLGFYDTVDLSGYAGTTANLGVKVDTDDEDIHQVDWAAAIDNAAVTVAEMFAAINLAGFTDITASADSATGRLLIVHDTPGDHEFLQVFAADTDLTFAAELDFGQGQEYGGEGLVYYKAFDSARTIALPKDIKDKEAISQESGDGTLIEVIIPAIIKGCSPVITTNDNDYEIKQLIQGGTWVKATSEYDPPMSSQTEKPIFTLHMFSELFSKGSNKRADKIGYLHKTIWSITGIEADETHDLKTQGSVAYNCTATEYEDKDDDKNPYYHDHSLTNDEYTDLDPENVPALTDSDT